jgi:hypothetical protein
MERGRASILLRDANRSTGVPALLYRVDDSHVSGPGCSRQLGCDRSDRSEAEYGDAVSEAHVTIADAAEGKLRGVEAQRVLPRHAVRHLEEVRVVHSVQDVDLPYASVAAHAVPDTELLHVGALLYNNPDPLVAKRRIFSVFGLLTPWFTLQEQPLVIVEEVGDEWGITTEKANLRAVLRGGVLDPDLHLVTSGRRFFVVNERGLPGRNCE